MTDSRLTPMMKQYRQAKADIPADAILLFRLGDFYELFFEDAERGSTLMDINLTKRNGYAMCGFPYHSLDTHLPRLLSSGVKVAIAEQVEDPKLVKGIVKREVTRIITPGTVTDTSALDPGQNNFLTALYQGKKHFGLACLDISTGEFKVTQISTLAKLETELNRIGARECVVSESQLSEYDANDSKPHVSSSMLWTTLDDWIFSFDCAEELLKRHFAVGSLDGFGCRNAPESVCAAGAVLHYAMENLRSDAGHIKSFKSYNCDEFMELDFISQRNLELIEPMFNKSARDATLLGVLDETVTPMGGRTLREWILRPLYNKQKIDERLESVEALRDSPLTMSELREVLGVVRDMERITARLNMGSANARDMLALADGLSVIPALKLLLGEFDYPLLTELVETLKAMPELVGRIRDSITEDPPLLLTEGGIIKSGCSAELDELRKASTEGKSWLGALQTQEQERTKIKNLKVRYNKVFGYYIEISKGNLPLVPEDYIRKQTLVNVERFITPELKEIENKILGAEEKSKALEYQLFDALRTFALEFTADIQQSANALGQLDVLCCFAHCAATRDYVRPRILEDKSLNIKAGRHPVLDTTIVNERFVPNDTFMDGDDNQLIIITGPNMAGKSTYIRQVALLVLMAQMGSFVPAESAEIGLVDRIFTRVGAADDIARGQSTFMVEMVETANILNHVTDRSLVILDEIGRGTSTFDGLSIAWAVAEYLNENARSRARTLFATHYHELTELSLTRKGVKNYNVAVREYGEKIIFLRQIIAGATDKSYGIHVAKLAGLPNLVIHRANEILDNLEKNALDTGGKPALAEHHENAKAKSGRKNKNKSKKQDDDDNGFQPLLF